MASKRVPGTHVPHTRDERGCRTNLVKSYWRKSGKLVSLKEFLATCSEQHVLEAQAAWLFNKHVNASKPPLGIGRTNGKSKSGDNKPKKEK